MQIREPERAMLEKKNKELTERLLKMSTEATELEDRLRKLSLNAALIAHELSTLIPVPEAPEKAAAL